MMIYFAVRLYELRVHNTIAIEVGDIKYPRPNTSLLVMNKLHLQLLARLMGNCYWNSQLKYTILAKEGKGTVTLSYVILNDSSWTL